MVAVSLARQAVRSAFWQVGGGMWITIVRLGASVFLARALTPADYGVFGMALLIREFIQQFGNFGMGTGVIAKKNASEDDLCTCFWFMALVRFVLFLLTFSCAPLGAWFFQDARVTDVVRVLSFGFLFTVLGSVSGTLLTKELKFKSLNIINGICAVIESGLAIFLVYNMDLGYWALVISMMVNILLSQASIFIVAKWWPKFKFSRVSFKYLFRFGINGLGFNFTNYLKQNLDYLLVGRLLGTASLGLYEFAYRVPHMVQDRISRPVGAVVFPVMSKVQDDNEKLAEGYLQTVRYVSLVSFPLLFGLAALSDLVVPALWGEQWLSIVTPLRFLCLCAVLRIAVQPLGAVYNCKNRPDIPFKISVIELTWTAVIISTLGYIHGINGVSVGMILSVLPSYYFLSSALKMIKSKISYLILSLWPIFLCSLMCSIAAFFMSKFLQSSLDGLIITLLISIISGAAIYGISLFAIFPKIFKDGLSKLKSISA